MCNATINFFHIIFGKPHFFVYKKAVKRSGFLQILVGHRSPGALFYSELNGNIGVKSKECLTTSRQFQLIPARFQLLM